MQGEAKEFLESLEKSQDLEDRIVAILMQPVMEKVDRAHYIQLKGRAKRIIKLFEECDPI
jgi:hypothetical protein